MDLLSFISLPDLSRIDGFAATIALLGYVVVFLALVLLYLVFYNLPSLLKMDFRKIAGKRRGKSSVKERENMKMTGEVNAAIGMTIYLYFNEIHDEESGIITIRKISKRYSPWSSKIYGLRHYPR